MTGKGCLSGQLLESFVELRANRQAEETVREHLSVCGDCRLRVRELEPSLLFAHVSPRTLPETEWNDVMRAVRRSVAENPRRSWRSTLAAWLKPRRLAPVALALGAGALVLSLVARTGVDPTMPPMARADLRADGPGSVTGRDFVYLSNPHAEITHMNFTGDDLESPILVTMVVDETLADVF